MSSSDQFRGMNTGFDFDIIDIEYFEEVFFEPDPSEDLDKFKNGKETILINLFKKVDDVMAEMKKLILEKKLKECCDLSCTLQFRDNDEFRDALSLIYQVHEILYDLRSLYDKFRFSKEETGEEYVLSEEEKQRIEELVERLPQELHKGKMELRKVFTNLV